MRPIFLWEMNELYFKLRVQNIIYTTKAAIAMELVILNLKELLKWSSKF